MIAAVATAETLFPRRADSSSTVHGTSPIVTNSPSIGQVCRLVCAGMARSFGAPCQRPATGPDGILRGASPGGGDVLGELFGVDLVGWVAVGGGVGAWVAFLRAWAKAGWGRDQVLGSEPMRGAIQGAWLGFLAYVAAGLTWYQVVALGAHEPMEYVPRALVFFLVPLFGGPILGLWLGRRKAVRRARAAGVDPDPAECDKARGMGALIGLGVGFALAGLWLVAWFAVAAYLFFHP
jgi:hypothetical protein